MSKQVYYWNLVDVSNDSSIVRYCHNCGKNMIFKDSKKRRRNANGKIIYEYAIYKCEKDHTWNLRIGIYKSSENMECNEVNDSNPKECSYDILDLIELKKQGVKEIEIILGEVTGRWRIDKLLGNRLRNISRSSICKLIACRRVLIDGKMIKRDYLLKRRQKIIILLDD